MSATFRTEEQATGFLTYCDGLTLERDTAQAEAAELRVEIARLRADNKRNRDLAAGYRNEAAEVGQRNFWKHIATARAERIAELDDIIAGAVDEVNALRDEVDQLHAVIADLRRDLGIRLP